ncbi:MAG TPA: S41 family peptidase [Candidatus Saccharimonadales bacterium]|nr:S41 family peptidase [Candidatus Saccharimonadales bacterium]
MGLKQKFGAIHWRHWLRKLCLLAAAAVIFCVGQAVGDGRLKIHRTHVIATGLPDQLDYATVNQLYQSLKNNYDGKLTANQLLNGLKHGLAEATADPYTEYFTPKEAKSFSDQLNNAFSGIGAQLGADASGNLQVIAPIAGTPAAKAGLKPKDLIGTINDVSTAGLSVDQAVGKIRGAAGTKVTLGIIRGSKAFTVTITRQNITLPSVTTHMLAGNIGYMQISTFGDDTSRLAEQAAHKFVQAHVKGVILDLRENPGGLVDDAINVSSLWLPDGDTVVQTKGTTGNQTLTAIGGDVLHGIPTVVLIDGGSASASEITTGALHDNGAAYVIGVKSYGKGVEQSLINFGDGSQLKVTVASWFRPNGQNINHKGITPDKVVQEPTSATALAANDAQLNAAKAYLASH